MRPAISVKRCRAVAPIKLPVGGFVLRFSPDFRTTELVADGFRNPYDFDFTTRRRAVHLRLRQRALRRPAVVRGLPRSITSCPAAITAGRRRSTPRRGGMPPYFIDVVAPIPDLGRGSPTGVACYRHRQFPEHYRGGMFLARLDLWPHLVRETDAAGRQLQRRGRAVLAIVGRSRTSPDSAGCASAHRRFVREHWRPRHPRRGYRISYPAGERTGFVTPDLPKLPLEWNNELKSTIYVRLEKDGLTRRRASKLSPVFGPDGRN